jgi:RNA polymerase sigma factor (sigma-70 family)
MEVNRKFSDEELVYSLKTGQDRNTAIRYMYSAYFGSLSGYIMSNQGSMEDAEDIFQEVLVNFIALLQEDKFRGESSVKTFLFSLNRFSWLNELKKRGRALAREKNYEREKDKYEADVSHLMIEKESTEKILDLVKELGETCRKILVMFYYENFSMKEILEQLDYETEQVVRNKKYKCLKQLEKMIGENPLVKQILKNLLHG